jgi:hypothetical protein
MQHLATWNPSLSRELGGRLTEVDQSQSLTEDMNTRGIYIEEGILIVAIHQYRIRKQ